MVDLIKTAGTFNPKGKVDLVKRALKKVQAQKSSTLTKTESELLNNHYYNEGLKDMLQKDVSNSGALVHEKNNMLGVLGLHQKINSLGKKSSLGDSYADKVKDFIRTNRKDPMKKTAGMFTDDQGNLTTGSKVGLGIGAAGLAGLGLHSYLSPDVAQQVAQQAPAQLSGGLMGDLAAAKQSIINAGGDVKDAAKSGYSSVKDAAAALANKAREAKTELGDTADYFMHGDQKAIDILNQAR